MSDLEVFDSILLKRLCEGEYDAFSLIYQRYVSSLYHYAKKIRMDEEEVEDAIQEVFASLWIRRAQVNILDLKAWLYTSLRKQMLYRLRKRKYQSTFESYLSFFKEDLQSNESIIGNISYKELLSEINKQLDLLSPQKKNVFILSRFQHKSHKEIAQELNISELTVKKQINNVLKIFRRKFSYKTFFTFLYSLIIFCATS